MKVAGQRDVGFSQDEREVLAVAALPGGEAADGKAGEAREIMERQPEGLPDSPDGALPKAGPLLRE